MESNDTVDDEESHTHACERMCCYCCRQSGHLVTKSTRANRPQRFIYFSNIIFFNLNLCENQFSVGLVLLGSMLEWLKCEHYAHSLFVVASVWFLLRAMMVTIFQDFGMRSRMRDSGDMWECKLGLSFLFASSRFFVHVGKMVSEWIDETISVLQNERKSHHVQVHMAYFYLA